MARWDVLLITRRTYQQQVRAIKVLCLFSVHADVAWEKIGEIGLGFPWHQDMFYFGQRWVTETTVGTWTAVDAADLGKGCLYVIPDSHRLPVAEHHDVEGSQQAEFKRVRDIRDEEGVALVVARGGSTATCCTRAPTTTAAGSGAATSPNTSARRPSGRARRAPALALR